jgi:hypothetical protein
MRFKVGDKIEYVGCTSLWHGRVNGIVTRVGACTCGHPESIGVDFGGGLHGVFCNVLPSSDSGALVNIKLKREWREI